MSKKHVRQILKQKRHNMSRDEMLSKSEKIKNTLFGTTEFQNAKTILFYVSYDNEVFTHDMIKSCINQGKSVIVPISNVENKSLILSEISDWTDLVEGAYGILEPKKESITTASIDEIGLIIVPGVGFDKKGHRIGHGMGYYDKLLHVCKDITKIGLSFELQLLDSLPVEDHDIKMNIIITEKQVITL